MSNSNTISTLPATSDYSYYTQIKTPDELGMKDKGTNIAKNFTGLIAYMNLLLAGDSKASKTGHPLGNRFFSATLSKCTDVNTNTSVPRHLYFDYIPTGKINIPMDITDTTQASINTGFKGLVPGIIEDLSRINPVSMLSVFKEDISPKCRQVVLDTINSNNQLGAETHYITLEDMIHIDPCYFSDNLNPVTNAKCKRPHKHVPPSNTINTSKNATPLVTIRKNRVKEAFGKNTDGVEQHYIFIILVIFIIVAYILSKHMGIFADFLVLFV
jgi:hypothetical protein